MKIVRPEKVTDAALIASNVAETVPVYNAGNTYAKLAVVRRDSDHGLYESQIDSNTGNSLDDPVKWLRTGPTNRWAMFDEYNQTQTENALSITGTLKPLGRITGMAFLNLDAASIDLTMRLGSNVIHSRTYSLVDNTNIGNWYDWFFEPIIRQTDLVLTDLPVHYGPTIDYAINAPGSVAGCGNLVIGSVRNFGDTVYGASVGIIDYTKKEADAYGTVNLKPGAYRKSGTFEVVVSRAMSDEIVRQLTQYRGVPIVYVGTGEYASTVLYGFYRDFSLIIDQPLQSRLNLEVEGVT